MGVSLAFDLLDGFLIWVVLLLVGLGRFWSALFGFGRLWSALVGFGRLFGRLLSVSGVRGAYMSEAHRKAVLFALRK